MTGPGDRPVADGPEANQKRLPHFQQAPWSIRCPVISEPIVPDANSLNRLVLRRGRDAGRTTSCG